ncbi:MAG: hypothetical protein CM15mP77_1340 [Synechococcus sp.]|nr:MAG: hypothetical protein CM15mP77_1340 [Synechococcus sp.]
MAEGFIRCSSVAVQPEPEQLTQQRWELLRERWGSHRGADESRRGAVLRLLDPATNAPLTTDWSALWPW